jgi:putative ABC transport system permease protein
MSYVIRQRRFADDLAEELEFHRLMSEQRLKESGIDATEARFATRRTLGNATLAQEDARAVWIWPWLESAWHDATYLLRNVRRQPGFVLVAAVTLGLGIGAIAGVFSVIDALMLRRPSFQHLERLVSVQESNPPHFPFDMNPSPGNFLDWREDTRAFDRMIAWRNWYFTLTEAGPGRIAAESVRGVRVSPDFFAMLELHPALGRLFRSDEEMPGKHQVVVLSDGLWQRRFGADRQIVGRSLLVDGQPFSVIGILPPDFQFFLSDFDLWMPLPVDASFHERESHSVMVLARLAPGISLAQGQAEMESFARRLGEAYPNTDAGWQMKVRPLYPTDEVRAVRPALLLLFGAAGLVMLIACANLAHLLLARTLARHKEIAVRAALGASRGRLIRQLVTESVLLAVLGGGAGLIIALEGVRWLLPLLPHAGTNRTLATFRAVAPTLDSRLLGFSMALAIVTGVVFGVIPAFQTTRSASLRVWAPSPANTHAGRLLMVVELALAIVLLTGAGLLLQSFWRLQTIDPGFRPDHLLTMQMWLPKAKYPTAPQIRGFYGEVIQRVRSVPAVEGASAISMRPFLSMGMGAPFDTDDGVAPSGSALPVTEFRVVTPGFASLIGQPLVLGRDFTEADGPDAEGVAIINESLARRAWPGRSPLGRRIRPAFHRSAVPWEVDAESR